MSCRSAIYTANTATSAIANNGVVPIGNIIRRYGPNINANGTAVGIAGCGYYSIDASVTLTAVTAGALLTAQLLYNGALIPGAIASYTPAATGDAVTLNLSGVVRNISDATNILTVVNTGAAATVTNSTVRVIKL